MWRHTFIEIIIGSTVFIALTITLSLRTLSVDGVCEIQSDEPWPCRKYTVPINKRLLSIHSVAVVGGAVTCSTSCPWSSASVFNSMKLTFSILSSENLKVAAGAFGDCEMSSYGVLLVTSQQLGPPTKYPNT